jgi:CHAT domain-containing protein
LELGKAVGRELKGGEMHSYELMLEAGQFVDVTIEQLGINVRGIPRKPDGTIITEADSHRGARGLEMTCLIAETTGRYRLDIRSMRPLAAPGKYRVSVTTLRTATPQDLMRLAAQKLYAEGDIYRQKTDSDSWGKARDAYQRALTRWEAVGDRPRQAVTLRQLSALSGRLGLGREALDEGTKALELYRALQDQSGEAHILFTMAEGLCWVLNEKDRALELYEQSLRICREIGERLIEGLVLQKLAILSRVRGENQKALDYVQPSLALLQAAGERGDALASFEELRAICESLDDKPKALAAFDQVRLLSRKNGERRIEAEALIEISRIHQAHGETQKALDSYNEALTVYRAHADPADEARVLISLGWLFAGLNQKQQTLDYFHRALAIYTALGDAGQQATVLKFLSRIYVSLGEMQKAIEQSYRALQIWHKIGNPNEEAAALFALGEVYRDLGDWQRALELSEQAAQRFHAIGDRAREANVLIYVGLAYRMLGAARQALERLNQAITLCQNLGARKDEAFALSQLAAVYQLLRDKERAAEAYLRCISLCRVVGDRPLEAGAVHNLGWLHFHHGDNQQAVEYHAQAAELYRRIGDLVGEANALRGLGRAYGALGQVEKGIDLCRQAIALARASREPAAEAIAFYALAQTYFPARRFAEARESLEAALRLQESVRANVINWELRASYLASSYRYYEFYIDVLMRMHEQNKSRGYDVAAFQASESSRARSLLELLAEAGADIRQGVKADLIEREQSLLQQISAKSEALRAAQTDQQVSGQSAELNRQLNALFLDLQQVRDQIHAANPRLAAHTEPKPLGVPEIQRQSLDRDTLLLEYSLGWERSYLWAVTPTSFHSFTMPKRAEIEEQAKKVYQLMTVRASRKKGETEAQWQTRYLAAEKQFPEEAVKLSRMLLGPVAARLGNKRLLIVADGALQYLPFAALPEPETGRQGEVETERSKNVRPVAPSPRRPVPLIVNHEIISLPSASTLAVLRRELAGRASAPKSVAMLADPVFSKGDLRVAQAVAQTPSDRSQPALPAGNSIAQREMLRSAEESGVVEGGGDLRRLEASRQEAQAIAAIAPKDQFLQALDFDASRATAMSEALGQYRIIHFATHGLVNSAHPALSGLVLSLVDEKGNDRDGFLRVHEIYNLRLPADLVVLSACQTALGREVSGEGLVGLTRGFMCAGVARVLATLWKVDDQKTASLMKAFYERLLGKDGQMRVTPAAALREAQIEMWRSRLNSAPFYWAGFVLQGEYK